LTEPGVLPYVIIIGAGPAGCATGLNLAGNGIHPLLLEKGQPGKDKACGDAWIPSAIEELRYIIDMRRPESKEHRFAHIDGYCSDRMVWSFDLAPFEGVIARRAIVDQYLRDRVSAAGASIWYRTEATNLRIRGRRVELTIRRGDETRTLTPSAVVLATGGGCRIARQAGLDGEPGLGAAVSSYIPTDANFAYPTFLFGESEPGYSWVFPMDENASNAGVFALSKAAASDLRTRMNALLAHLGVSGALPTRGGVLPLWSGKGTAWSHEAGVVSCGDAAGLVDPISGEGLTAALVSGKRAGEAVASFLSGNFGALHGYSRWVRDWGQARYAPSLENRVLAAWVGLAPAERQLLTLLAGLEP
jgi:geranylgeranyl reductase family protein